MLTDHIADFLTRLRNASHARRRSVSVQSSRMSKAIAKVLLEKQFIENFEEQPKGKNSELIITFRINRDPLELKRISKPGQRIYVGYKNIKRIRNGLGVGIISTSQGILSNEEARRKKAGGEYLAEVY